MDLLRDHDDAAADATRDLLHHRKSELRASRARHRADSGLWALARASTTRDLTADMLVKLAWETRVDARLDPGAADAPLHLADARASALERSDTDVLPPREFLVCV